MEVVNYSNYIINPDGTVYSKNYNRCIKPFLNDRGYPRCELCNEGNRRKFLIHRLVAEHFIPNPNNYTQVDHINHIRTDNNVSNLRWVTRRQNQHNRVNNAENINIYPRRNGTYRVDIQYQKKRVFDKTFDKLEEAILARDNFYVNNPEIK
jgi:hypothetical protein